MPLPSLRHHDCSARGTSSGSRSRRSTKIAKPIVEEETEVVLPPAEVLPPPEVVEPSVAVVVKTVKKVEPEKIVEKPVSKIANPSVNVEIKK